MTDYNYLKDSQIIFTELFLSWCYIHLNKFNITINKCHIWNKRNWSCIFIINCIEFINYEYDNFITSRISAPVNFTLCWYPFDNIFKPLNGMILANFLSILVRILLPHCCIIMSLVKLSIYGNSPIFWRCIWSMTTAS